MEPMKIMIVAYTILYLLSVIGAAGYSLKISKRMDGLRFSLTLLAVLVVAVTLFFYAQTYQPIQMVAFALAFTSISTLFLYNGLKNENPNFLVMMALSGGRLIIHIQLLVFLYLFR